MTIFFRFFKAVEYGQRYIYYLERVQHEERSAHTDVTYLHIPFKSRLEIGWQATYDLRLLETQVIKNKGDIAVSNFDEAINYF